MPSTSHLPVYANSRDAAKLIGVSRSTLKRWRLDGLLTRGVHYYQPSKRMTLFNVALLIAFVKNRHSPKAHADAIDAALAS